MKLKQYLIAASMTLATLTQTNAGTLTLRTYIEGDVEQNNSQQLLRNLPFDLTLTVSNPADPNGDPLWSYNIPRFGMQGNASAINIVESISIKDVPSIPQLSLAQLNFKLAYKAGDDVRALTGCFMGKTFKPLTDIFFHLNTTTQHQSADIFVQGKIVPNFETENTDFEKVVYYAGSPYQNQTFLKKNPSKDYPNPFLNAYNNMGQAIRLTPTSLVVYSLIPSQVIAGWSSYNFTNFPIQVTVTDGTPESKILFQQTLIMGNPQSTTLPFVLDEFIPTVFDLPAPLPPLQFQALKVNFQNAGVDSTFAYGTDRPLSQIFVSTQLTSSPISPIVPIAPVVFPDLNENKNVGALCLMSGNSGSSFLTLTQYPQKSLDVMLRKDFATTKSGWFGY